MNKGILDLIEKVITILLKLIRLLRKDELSDNDMVLIKNISRL